MLKRLKNGRFSKKSYVEKQIKAAKARSKISETGDRKLSIVKGNRILNVEHLLNEFFCDNQICKNRLHFQDIINERNRGIASLWYLKCSFCGQIKLVHTSEQYSLESLSQNSRHEINAKIAAGSYNFKI